MAESYSSDFLFSAEEGYLRIPIWGHIPLDKTVKKILSHPSFLRLKGVRQLSFAHHVYPGAMHTRFEHSIGVFHLTRIILQRMRTNSLAKSLQRDDFCFDDPSCKLILMASLLHDIGHYPHAHMIENIAFTSQDSTIFEHHQSLAKDRLFESYEGKEHGTLADIIHDGWHVNPNEVADLILGHYQTKFTKLISGTLDPDKMDYLMRDAHHCNVPYGGIDIWRLVESFVPNPDQKRLSITEKGIAPLESLMFTKYMMMRNVYWHHTVRTLASMLIRAILDTSKYFEMQTLRRCFYTNSDEQVLYDLLDAIPKENRSSRELLECIIHRRIYKRVIEIPFVEVKEVFLKKKLHIAEERKKIELGLCSFLHKKYAISLRGNEVLIDVPNRKSIFDYDDFLDLMLYNPSDIEGHQGTFSLFHQTAKSLFKSEFILDFSDVTKVVRIVAREDIAKLLRKEKKFVLDYIVL